MDLDKAERAKRAAELDTIFTTVVAEGRELLHAEKVTLFMVDAETNQVWSRLKSGGTVDNLRELRASFESLDTTGDGYISLKTIMQALNDTSLVVDVRSVKRLIIEKKLGKNEAEEAESEEYFEMGQSLYNHADFKILIDELMGAPEIRFYIRPGSLIDTVVRTGKHINAKDGEETLNFAVMSLGDYVHSVLYYPVINEDGKTMAIIEAQNRYFYEGAYVGPFTEDDVRLCRLLCSHVAQFMKQSGAD